MRSISNSWTIVFKILAAFFIFVACAAAILSVIGGFYGGLVMFLMVFLLRRPFFAYRIAFSEGFVMMKGWRKAHVYPLENVVGLRGGYLHGIDPFFEVDIKTSNGEERSFHFHPTFLDATAYKVNKEFAGHLRAFLVNVRYARERSAAETKQY